MHLYAHLQTERLYMAGRRIATTKGLAEGYTVFECCLFSLFPYFPVLLAGLRHFATE